MIARSLIARPAQFVASIALSCVMVGNGLSAHAQESAAPRPTDPSIFNTPGNILPSLGDGGTYLPEVAPAQDESKVVKLVLKRSERRVYVYEGEKVVSSYRVAVGKAGWETPLGTFKVLSMEENPIFKSFKSGRIIEPGPDNPLGVRWIGIWTDGKTQLGFHGTNEPELIGQAVSHGCIRMHNKDVTKLYGQVKEGTVVTVVP
jgi:L,D-transpeptidase ErfK/SrfK